MLIQKIVETWRIWVCFGLKSKICLFSDGSCSQNDKLDDQVCRQHGRVSDVARKFSGRANPQIGDLGRRCVLRTRCIL